MTKEQCEKRVSALLPWATELYVRIYESADPASAGKYTIKAMSADGPTRHGILSTGVSYRAAYDRLRKAVKAIYR